MYEHCTLESVLTSRASRGVLPTYVQHCICNLNSEPSLGYGNQGGLLLSWLLYGSNGMDFYLRTSWPNVLLKCWQVVWVCSRLAQLDSLWVFAKAGGYNGPNNLFIQMLCLFLKIYELLHFEELLHGFCRAYLISSPFHSPSHLLSFMYFSNKYSKIYFNIFVLWTSVKLVHRFPCVIA